MPTVKKRSRGRAKPPYLWYLITVGGWRLDPIDGWLFWQALSRSRFSRPSEVRQKILLWRGPVEEVPGWIARALRAQDVVASVEDLVTEHLLSRTEATAIEDSIFRCIDKDGVWK